MKASQYLSWVGLVVVVIPVAVKAQFTTADNGDNTLTITGYTGSGGNVEIPSRINGLPVTRIGDFAFQGVTSLTSLTIPDSVASIEHNAFAYCTSQTRVTIGNGLTVVGLNAF